MILLRSVKRPATQIEETIKGPEPGGDGFILIEYIIEVS
jgi:hypothetical protein